MLGARVDYTPDDTARLAKQTEIQEILKTFNETKAPLDSTSNARLMKHFVNLTAPLNPPIIMEMIVMSQLGRGGARSRKPGNITLNWSSLLELAPDVTLAGASATETHWLVPFAALYIWMKLYNAASIEITEKDALVLYSLWQHKNSDRKISEDDAFLRTHTIQEENGLTPITRKQFDDAINNLLSLECIELNNGIIWLREWVRIRY